MTQASAPPPALPPLHMRRTAFDPAPELRETRESTGVQQIETVFGTPAHLVTGHDDITEILSDARARSW